MPRCKNGSAGADEFGMIWFEQRWRFIYTDLFEAPPSVAKAPVAPPRAESAPASAKASARSRRPASAKATAVRRSATSSSNAREGCKQLERIVAAGGRRGLPPEIEAAACALDRALHVRGVREYGESRVASNLLRYATNSLPIILRAMRDIQPLKFFGGIALLQQLRIQADARVVEKDMAVDVAHVRGRRLTRTDELEGAVEVERDVEPPREEVEGA